MYKYVIDRIFL